MTDFNVLEKIKLELKELSKNPENIKDYSRFYKDGKKYIGFSSLVIKRTAFSNFKEIKNLPKKQIFYLCEKLLSAPQNGYLQIAFDWAFRIRKQYAKEDLKIFERWIKKYVDGWGSCDDLCSHALGEFVFRFPEVLPNLRKWAKSKNMWFRRASAVALIYSLRRGKYLNEAFDTAKILLQDREDLVQKGCGWTLKEASKFYQKEVFDFVIKNKSSMPRVALRYAIEKMPQKMKTMAMDKKWKRFHCLKNLSRQVLIFSALPESKTLGTRHFMFFAGEKISGRV